MREDEIRALWRRDEDAAVKLFMQMQDQINGLTLRTAELERRLHQNSQNSHQPPSHDGPSKGHFGFDRPAPKSQRKKSGRESGGQPGHEGTTLKLADPADHIEEYWPQRCGCCGRYLGQESVSGYERRQVHDVPVIKIEVTEHRRMEVVCETCGAHTQGEYPASVTNVVQYGSGMKALMTYLVTQHLLPLERSGELLKAIVNGQPSEGTIVNAVAECAAGLSAVEIKIKQALLKVAMGHFDETSLRVMKKLYWLHVISTDQLTFYALDEKRGQQAHERIGILPQFKGTAVHDAYASYFGYDMLHGLCNAHLLRDLTSVEESTSQLWPIQMKDLLLSIKTTVDTTKATGATALPATQIDYFQILFRTLVQSGLSANPPPERLPGQRGRLKQSPARNLLERLRDHEDAVLRFMHDFNVPFDNNQAERDLRMMKVKQKISGCFRSLDGAQAFCRIRGYISTIRKQGGDVLAALRSVFDGSPFVPTLS